MRVLFDISVTGLAELHPRHRTGIFRVVEGFLDELRSAPGITLRTTAIDGIVARSLATRYLRGRRIAGLDPAAATLPNRAHAALYMSFLNLSRSRQKLAGRAVRRSLRELLGTIERRYRPLAPSDLDGADVLHSPYHAFPESTRGHRIARVLTIHDLIPLVRPELGYDGGAFLRGVLTSLRPRDWITCDSEATRRDVTRLLPDHPPEQIRVVYPAVKDYFAPVEEKIQTAVRRELRLPEAPYFLSVGTLEKRKNVAHLIAAYGAWARRVGKSAPFLFLVGAPGEGSGPLRKLAEEAAPGRVRFTGYVDDADLVPLYSGCRGYLFPSLAEGFGLPLLEAMRCGAPIVCSREGSLPEVGGDAAIYVPATDPAAWEAALDRLGDEAERRRLRASSLERARAFSWARTGEALRAVYRAASGTA